MENQIEMPYNLIHGYTDGLYEDHNSFNIPWCATFPSPYDHHNNPHQCSSTINASSNAFEVPYSHGETLLVDHAPALMLTHNRSTAQAMHGSTSVVSTLFGTIHAELGKMTAQEMMDAKALAASKSHSEAERRRRERINGHLAKLRSLLPNTTKTDKASLLAEVIQHVKELKRQTSEIAVESSLPSEDDELTVRPELDVDGNLIVRATLCCEDRTDLLPDLIKAIKSLKLRTLKAEITTVGGRFRNVLIIASETLNSGEDDNRQQQSIEAIQEALKSVVEQKSKQDSCSSSAGGSKRQRTNSLCSTSR